MPAESVDWELLRLTIETERRRLGHGRHSPDALHTREDRTRLRVAVNGRMGQSTTWSHAQPGAQSIQQAITAATSGQQMSMPFGTNYSHSDYVAEKAAIIQSNLMQVPGILEVANRRRSAEFATAGGASLSWEHIDTRVVLGFQYGQATVPVGALRDDEIHGDNLPICPAVSRLPVYQSCFPLRPMLWSPLALSRLLLPSWVEQLGRHGQTIGECPRGVALVDDGSGPPTDLEGTKRRQVTLIGQKSQICPVRTIASASGPDELTGHGGFSAPEFECITISPETVRSEPESSVCHVITDLRRLSFAANLIALKVLKASEQPPGTMVVSLNEPAELLWHGHWVYPIQRGNGPWRSPWWELPEPAKVLTVLHLEA